MRASNRRSCSSSLTENQYLIKHDAVLDQQTFEDRALPKEPVVLRGGAETQHALHAGAVVPAAVEQDDLACGRQLLHVPLEVPLRGLALGGLGQRDVLGDARVRVLHDALDHAALARRVASLEDHRDPGARLDDPLLHLHELFLQPVELLLVRLLRELRTSRSLLFHGFAHRVPPLRECRWVWAKTGQVAVLAFAVW